MMYAGVVSAAQDDGGYHGDQSATNNRALTKSTRKAVNRMASPPGE
jgi:hypothetical protein